MENPYLSTVVFVPVLSATLIYLKYNYWIEGETIVKPKTIELQIVIINSDKSKGA